MRCLILLLPLLAGCASPAMSGAQARVVDVEGSRFRVYHPAGSDEVEVHRISLEAFPSQTGTMTRALAAIAMATGCPVLQGSLVGDPALMRARLDCGDQG